MTAQPATLEAPERSLPRSNVADRLGAAGVLLGIFLSTFGISFDIEWHTDVGPDTFFTLSHLMLYAGSAIAGLASLVMVLRSTAAQRAGRPLPGMAGGVPVRVFRGAFTAPLGYLVSGVGAASFLLYGLMDLQWHSTYGFDAVLGSPPHIALFLSISLTMVGSIIVNASQRATRSGRIGLLLSIPVLIVFGPITTNAISHLPLPFDPLIAGTALISVLLLAMGAIIMAKPGYAVAVAVVLGVLQIVLWFFSPWAAHAYAAASGLPLRDGLANQPPHLPSAIPMFLIVAGLVIEVAVRAARSQRLPESRALILGGALAGLIVALTLPLQQLFFDPQQIPFYQLVLVGTSGVLFGALGGFLGLRIGLILTAATRPGRQQHPSLSSASLEGQLS